MQTKKKMNNKEMIDDTDLFIYSIIGEQTWDKIPAIKKIHILKKYSEIQEIVKKNYFS
jgi:hypothetical protein